MRDPACLLHASGGHACISAVYDSFSVGCIRRPRAALLRCALYSSPELRVSTRSWLARARA
jgi:hypothetical protein